MLSKQKQDRLRHVKAVKNKNFSTSVPNAIATIEPDHAEGTPGKVAQPTCEREYRAEPSEPTAVVPDAIYVDFEPIMPIAAESTGPGTIALRAKLNIPPNTPVGRYPIRVKPGCVLVNPDYYKIRFDPEHCTIRPATPKIMWSVPVAICLGTPLGDEQLNATAEIPGSFGYSHAQGDFLGAGSHVLSATFTPTDSHNYQQF